MKIHYEAHRLKSNHNSSLPRRFIFLDVETSKIEEENRIRLPFRMACTCYENHDKKNKSTRQEWNFFYSQQDLAEYIINKSYEKTKLYIVTHNADFDSIASGILYYLTRNGYGLQFFYAKGMIFLLSCAKDKRKITIISNTNFWAYSLKKLGKLFDLHKQEISIFDADNETLEEYCKRDVEILRVSFLEWLSIVKDFDLGSFRVTKASQAFTSFRHRFMNHPIYIHEEKSVKELERRSYCGGRCEAYRIGRYDDGPFSKYDFNSNYATVMKYNDFPTKLMSHHIEPDLVHVKKLIDNYLCIGDCVINTDIPLYPMKFRNTLYFPVGTFKTTLCSDGIKEAIKRNHLVRVSLIACYHGEKIFNDYINFFYPLKLQAQIQGNLPKRTIFKDLMNSLYGKFGEQRPIRTMYEEKEGKVCYREFILVDGSKHIGMKTKLVNTVFEDIGIEDTDHTFVAIASHVTEYARHMLYRIYEMVGLPHIYYSDTDSLIIQKRHVYKLDIGINPIILGDLNKEGEADEIEIFGPKSYRFGDEIKLKGVPKKSIKNAQGDYEYESFMRSISLIKEGKLLEVELKKVEKSLSNEVKKGILLNTGYVKPFSFPSDLAAFLAVQ